MALLSFSFQVALFW